VKMKAVMIGACMLIVSYNRCGKPYQLIFSLLRILCSLNVSRIEVTVVVAVVEKALFIMSCRIN